MTPDPGRAAANPVILAEDDDLLVVDKPGGMICHSAQRPGQVSLVDWLRDRGLATPRLVNRLDRETSGLVVIAKNEQAARVLGRQMAQRRIGKEYLAIVWGVVDEADGVIDDPIGLARDAAVYTRRAVDHAHGESALTRFSVSERLEGFTVLRLQPETGRTHQLRVHLSARGFPVVGDKIYGPDERLYLEFIRQGVTASALARLLLPRHALHAQRVTFIHPTRNEPVGYEAPLAADLEQFIAAHQPCAIC